MCGCNAHLTPGAVARAHLESRKYESTRNEDWNNAPACLYLSDWLDHHHQGVQAKASLLEMAKAKGERLEPAECYHILNDHGYYYWLTTRRI